MDAVAWGEMRVVDLGGLYPDRDPTFIKNRIRILPNFDLNHLHFFLSANKSV